MLVAIPVESFQGAPGHHGVPGPDLLEAHGEKVMPVVEEDGFLRHAEEAGDQWEDSHPMLLASAHVKGLRVKRFHEPFQAWHVDFVLHNGCNKQQKYNTNLQYRMIANSVNKGFCPTILGQNLSGHQFSATSEVI